MPIENLIQYPSFTDRRFTVILFNSFVTTCAHTPKKGEISLQGAVTGKGLN